MDTVANWSFYSDGGGVVLSFSVLYMLLVIDWYCEVVVLVVSY